MNAPRAWGPQHLNCLWDSLDALMRSRDLPVEVIAQQLVQPLDFGFEIELGTRDWWLGGSSGIRFQRPAMFADLSCRWVNHDGDSFASVLKEFNPTPNRPLLFQLEWHEVDYNPHYGYNSGDIHVASVLAFDPTSESVLVRDRMSGSSDLFDEKTFQGWVPMNTYETGASRRLRVLEWTLPVHPRNCRIKDVITKSGQWMTKSPELFAPGPHGHIATGLEGIKYFADAIEAYAPQYSGDSQTRMLLGVRLVDSARTVVGDRLILKAVLSEISGDSPVRICELIQLGIADWRTLTKQLVVSSTQDLPSLTDVSKAIRDCLRSEERIVSSICESLDDPVWLIYEEQMRG